MNSVLERLLTDADALKYGDPERMMSSAIDAAALAQRLGDFQGYGQALNLQAWAHLNRHHYERSLTFATEALRLARAYGYGEIEARAVNIAGLNFFRCGIAYEASRLYEHQLALAQRLGSGELEAAALHDLALIKMSDGDPDKDALDTMRRALTLMPVSVHDGMDRSVIHSNLSWCYIHDGQLDDAQTHLEQALALVPKEKSPSVAGNAHLNLASVYMARGDLPAAAAQLELARGCITGDTPDILSVNVALVTAELMDTEGRHREAMPWWERTYEQAFAAQMTEFAGRVLNAMKDGYERLGDSDGVISVYKRLTEDIPTLQKQNNEIRFAVLRAVFTGDDSARQTLRTLSEHKHAVLRKLSDELVQPLTLIKNAAEAALDVPGALTLEQRQERLRHITEHVAHMTALFEQVVAVLDQFDDTQAAS